MSKGYTKKQAAYLVELNKLMDGIPDEWTVAKYAVEYPEDGKRLIWLLVATGHQVLPRVLRHFGWWHPQQIRDEAWSPDAPLWPDHMNPNDPLYQAYLEATK